MSVLFILRECLRGNRMEYEFHSHVKIPVIHGAGERSLDLGVG